MEQEPQRAGLLVVEGPHAHCWSLRDFPPPLILSLFYTPLSETLAAAMIRQGSSRGKAP